MPRSRRVLAIGWFGAGNLGDEALLEGLQRWLVRAAGPVDLTVTSSDPAGTRAAHGVKAIRLRPPAASGFRDLDLVRTAWRADLVTLGGGDLIREQADGTVPALNWLSRMRVPFRLGRPTALIGVSVGELVTPRVIEAVKREVERFRLLAARDTESAERLSQLSGRPVALIGDLALEAIEPVPPAAPSPRPRIAVATREILGRGPAIPEDAGGRLEAALALALDRVVDATGALIELIPFRPSAAGRRRDDDERAGASLASRARTGSGWLRRPAPVDVQSFSRLMATVDLVVSVRLHGAVLGAGAGRRVVGVAYDPKVSGFLGDLGLADQVIPLDADARLISDVIFRAIADPSLEARTAAGVATVRARTRALDSTLASLLARS